VPPVVSTLTFGRANMQPTLTFTPTFRLTSRHIESSGKTTTVFCAPLETG